MKVLHLQGLRALSIVAVALFHFFPSLFPNGYLGVDQFFLLSGYLMTMMLNRKPKLAPVDIGNFLYRRLHRITPLYYLIIFLILVSLKWAPDTSLSMNYDSAPKAIGFASNLFKQASQDGYFEKLGLAMDMFTHMWSLSVEVQFYLLFPLFFVLVSLLPPRFHNHAVIITGLASLIFYFSVDHFLAFNCVFCRIWQFLTGMLVFNLSKKKTNSTQKSLDEETPFLESNDDESEKPTAVASNSFAIGALLFCSVLLLWSEKIDEDFARVNITALTAAIIHLGHGVRVMENVAVVLIGEASYCWYLIHWPIVAHLRFSQMEKGHGQYHLFFLFFSLLLSLGVHFFYEKQYLQWSKKTVLSVVGILLAANLIFVLKTDNYSDFSLPENSQNSTVSNATNATDDKRENLFIFPSDNYVFGPMGYENLSNSAKAEYQRNFDRHDNPQTQAYLGIYEKDTEMDHLYYSRRATNDTNDTFMVIGNSVAENTIGVVKSACEEKFQTLSIAAVGGCEPLVRSLLRGYSGFDCTIDGFFLKAVKKVQPDVLFIITRHIDFMLIEEGTNPMNDGNFKTAIARLQEYEKIVKKRIYIVEPWPETSPDITRKLNDYLEAKVPFDDSTFVDMQSQRVLVGKQRLSRIVAACKKCRLFDFATMFYFNGKFKMYDPVHFVSFVTAGRHFSPPGLKRIWPLIRDICNQV